MNVAKVSVVALDASEDDPGAIVSSSLIPLNSVRDDTCCGATSVGLCCEFIPFDVKLGLRSQGTSANILRSMRYNLNKNSIFI